MVERPELGSRKSAVLRAVVEEYVRSGEPVGSETIAERSGLGVSSATIRNELAQLEQLGYLMHPHTSAGRIPTDSGYRYYVEMLMDDDELPQNEQRTIDHQFHQARLDLDQWMRLASSVLARTSGSAAIITAPHATKAKSKHLQLISTQGRLVLLILVLMDGAVKQEMSTLSDPLDQDTRDESSRAGTR